MSLSKSLFMKGLQCEKQLWLKKHRKDLKEEVTADAQSRFDQGQRVGELARDRFPGGVLIKADHEHLMDALAETRAALKSGASILYEGTFEHGGILVRADILRKSNEARGKWELYEVKASNKEKDVYWQDIAVQAWVLEGAGLKLAHRRLMHLDREYIRAGELDLNMLFAFEEMTEGIESYTDKVPKDLARFLKVLQSKQEPAIEVGKQCNDPYECPFQEYCWRKIPEYSIYNICWISPKKIALLRKDGILKVKDVPDHFDLTENQRLQVLADKTGKPQIDEKEVKKLLAGLQEPLSFLDFETIFPAIPPYDGLHPYAQMPFQFSLRLYRGGRETEHVEFLGDGKTDPRAEIARLLASKVPDEGSVIAYNAPFEGSRLKELAAAFPPYAKKLNAIRNRLWDLETPFKNRAYVHPKFHGRSSIKEVLPALIPGMTYEGMEIGEGGAASLAYFQMMGGELTGKEADHARKALLEYCGQDTLAMVKVLEALSQALC